MHFADCYAAVSIVLTTRRKAAAIQEIRERSWRHDRVIFVAEAGKEIVVLAYSLVHSNIKIVLIDSLFGGHQVVVAADIEAGQWRREQCSKASGYGVDRLRAGCWEYIGGKAARTYANRHAAHSGRVVSACSDRLSEVWVKYFALVRRISSTIENIQSSRGINNWRAQIQETREIARQLCRSRNQQQLRQRLPNAQAFVINKEEGLVLDDRT